MKPADRLDALEARYLAAREARDRLDVARATGAATRAAGIEAEARTASSAVHRALASFPVADVDRLGAEDRRALDAIRAGIGAADDDRLPVAATVGVKGCDDDVAWRAAIAAGGAALRDRLEVCYAATADTLPVDGGTMTRLGLLQRLAMEPDAGVRRDLFLALQPLWVVVNGDDAGRSPYRRLIRDTAPEWRAGRGTVAANAAALGIRADEVDSWSRATLAAWRAAVVEPSRGAGESPVEPWDWWWRAGAVQRLAGRIGLARVIDLNRRLYTSLGADPDALGVAFDLRQRGGRPAVPVAFTSFGARPHRRPDGTWTSARPIVMATYRDGGFDELAELVHETGHAIHVAGIRTRPAFTDWPDSDALTEALADLVAFDLAEPAWRRRWLPGGPEVPEPLSMRCHYAAVVLDAAWAQLEQRLLADPSRSPNETWTEITSSWLGIVPHPEWSWWAIRGQLVQAPGYMANYALGAVLATSLRAAIRAARGDWLDGDPGWYAWVRDRIYRFGRERSSGDVVREVLGGGPSPDALLSEIARARSPSGPGDAAR